jgi:hypothetical protein
MDQPNITYPSLQGYKAGNLCYDNLKKCESSYENVMDEIREEIK